MKELEYRVLDKRFSWDMPKKEVMQIAKRFNYGSYERNELRLPYRLYTPENQETVPMVIYLHGAGGNGNDNEKQLSSNPAIEFAREG